MTVWIMLGYVLGDQLATGTGAPMPGVLEMLVGGGVMLAVAIATAHRFWRRRHSAPLLSKTPEGVTEVGRQPYTVYGHLLTADSMSPVEAPAVAASLIAFIIVYFFVFGAGTFYILRLMKRMPRDPMPDLDDGPIRTSGVMPGPATGKTHGSQRHGN